MPINRILITGGAGFIGSHTVDALLKEGKEVIVLDNLYSGKMDNLNMSHPELTFIEGDVLDFTLVQELVADCDAVLHLAAIVSVPFSIKEPIYAFQVNTQGFFHVLEAVRKTRRGIRIVHASSAAVYGEVNELPCRDDAPLSGRPLSPYALHKKHNEDYGELYDRLHQIQNIALRYFNVYGERQDPSSPYSGVISRFIQAQNRNESLTIYGDGKQTRDFISVEDVVKANLLALTSHYSGVMNIATGKANTLLSLIKYIATASQRQPEVKFEPPRQGDVFASYASVAKAKSKIHFEATVTLEQGIDSLVNNRIRET